MKLIKDLKAIKCNAPRTSQSIAKFYSKLNEIAKKLDTIGLLTTNSLALYFFIQGFSTQFKQTFEIMQKEFRN
jgi:hypothetical protein